MAMAAREEAKEAILVDGRVRWAVGIYWRATESELTGRGMQQAMEMGRRAGMREAVAKGDIATGIMLRLWRIEQYVRVEGIV